MPCVPARIGGTTPSSLRGLVVKPLPLPEPPALLRAFLLFRWGKSRPSGIQARRTLRVLKCVQA